MSSPYLTSIQNQPISVDKLTKEKLYYNYLLDNIFRVFDHIRGYRLAPPAVPPAVPPPSGPYTPFTPPSVPPPVVPPPSVPPPAVPPPSVPPPAVPPPSVPPPSGPYTPLPPSSGPSTDSLQTNLSVSTPSQKWFTVKGKSYIANSKNVKIILQFGTDGNVIINVTDLKSKCETYTYIDSENSESITTSNTKFIFKKLISGNLIFNDFNIQSVLNSEFIEYYGNLECPTDCELASTYYESPSDNACDYKILKQNIITPATNGGSCNQGEQRVPNGISNWYPPLPETVACGTTVETIQTRNVPPGCSQPSQQTIINNGAPCPINCVLGDYVDDKPQLGETCETKTQTQTVITPAMYNGSCEVKSRTVPTGITGWFPPTAEMPGSTPYGSVWSVTQTRNVPPGCHQPSSNIVTGVREWFMVANKTYTYSSGSYKMVAKFYSDGLFIFDSTLDNKPVKVGDVQCESSIFTESVSDPEISTQNGYYFIKQTNGTLILNNVNLTFSESNDNLTCSLDCVLGKTNISPDACIENVEVDKVIKPALPGGSCPPLATSRSPANISDWTPVNINTPCGTDYIQTRSVPPGCYQPSTRSVPNTCPSCNDTPYVDVTSNICNEIVTSKQSGSCPCDQNITIKQTTGIGDWVTPPAPAGVSCGTNYVTTQTRSVPPGCAQPTSRTVTTVTPCARNCELDTTYSDADIQDDPCNTIQVQNIKTPAQYGGTCTQARKLVSKSSQWQMRCKDGTLSTDCDAMILNGTSIEWTRNVPPGCTDSSLTTNLFFTALTFTSLGAIGPYGPPTDRVFDPIRDVTRFRVYNGYQYLRITISGNYKFTVSGAYNSAIITGTFPLVRDRIIVMVVGQLPTDSASSTIKNGGGGTYVVALPSSVTSIEQGIYFMNNIIHSYNTFDLPTGFEILLICGGGTGPNGGKGGIRYDTASSSFSDTFSANPGGSSGYAGEGFPYTEYSGGSGAGFFGYDFGNNIGNGTGDIGINVNPTYLSALSFFSGSTGGRLVNDTSKGGGFGGGGAGFPSTGVGGGGGGYSGGGSGRVENGIGKYGGGGSYFGSGTVSVISGTNTGSGFVRIEPATTSTSCSSVSPFSAPTETTSLRVPSCGNYTRTYTSSRTVTPGCILPTTLNTSSTQIQPACPYRLVAGRQYALLNFKKTNIQDILNIRYKFNFDGTLLYNFYTNNGYSNCYKYTFTETTNSDNITIKDKSGNVLIFKKTLTANKITTNENLQISLYTGIVPLNCSIENVPNANYSESSCKLNTLDCILSSDFKQVITPQSNLCENVIMSQQILTPAITPGGTCNPKILTVPTGIGQWIIDGNPPVGSIVPARRSVPPGCAQPSTTDIKIWYLVSGNSYKLFETGFYIDDPEAYYMQILTFKTNSWVRLYVEEKSFGQIYKECYTGQYTETDKSDIITTTSFGTIKKLTPNSITKDGKTYELYTGDLGDCEDIDCKIDPNGGTVIDNTDTCFTFIRKNVTKPETSGGVCGNVQKIEKAGQWSQVTPAPSGVCGTTYTGTQTRSVNPACTSMVPESRTVDAQAPPCPVDCVLGDDYLLDSVQEDPCNYTTYTQRVLSPATNGGTCNPGKRKIRAYVGDWQFAGPTNVNPDSLPCNTPYPVYRVVRTVPPYCQLPISQLIYDAKSCPKDCVLGDYKDDQNQADPCNVITQTQEITEPAIGGGSCNPLKKSVPVSVGPWSEWSEWSTVPPGICNTTYTVSRNRTRDLPPGCTQSSIETENKTINTSSCFDFVVNKKYAAFNVNWDGCGDYSTVYLSFYMTRSYLTRCNIIHTKETPKKFINCSDIYVYDDAYSKKTNYVYSEDRSVVLGEKLSETSIKWNNIIFNIYTGNLPANCDQSINTQDVCNPPPLTSSPTSSVDVFPPVMVNGIYYLNNKIFTSSVSFCSMNDTVNIFKDIIFNNDGGFVQSTIAQFLYSSTVNYEFKYIKNFTINGPSITKNNEILYSIRKSPTSSINLELQSIKDGTSYTQLSSTDFRNYVLNSDILRDFYNNVGVDDGYTVTQGIIPTPDNTGCSPITPVTPVNGLNLSNKLFFTSYSCNNTTISLYIVFNNKKGFVKCAFSRYGHVITYYEPYELSGIYILKNNIPLFSVSETSSGLSIVELSTTRVYQESGTIDGSSVPTILKTFYNDQGLIDGNTIKEGTIPTENGIVCNPQTGYSLSNKVFFNNDKIYYCSGVNIYYYQLYILFYDNGFVTAQYDPRSGYLKLVYTSNYESKEGYIIKNDIPLYRYGGDITSPTNNGLRDKIIIDRISDNVKFTQYSGSIIPSISNFYKADLTDNTISETGAIFSESCRLGNLPPLPPFPPYQPAPEDPPTLPTPITTPSQLNPPVKVLDFTAGKYSRSNETIRSETSKEGCKNICASDNQCSMWEFNNNICKTYKFNEKETVVTGLYTLMNQYYYAPEKIDTFLNKTPSSSVYDCAKICGSNPSCGLFYYDSVDKSCSLVGKTPETNNTSTGLNKTTEETRFTETMVFRNYEEFNDVIKFDNGKIIINNNPGVNYYIINILKLETEDCTRKLIVLYNGQCYELIKQKIYNSGEDYILKLFKFGSTLVYIEEPSWFYKRCYYNNNDCIFFSSTKSYEQFTCIKKERKIIQNLDHMAGFNRSENVSILMKTDGINIRNSYQSKDGKLVIGGTECILHTNGKFTYNSTMYSFYDNQFTSGIPNFVRSISLPRTVNYEITNCDDELVAASICFNTVGAIGFVYDKQNKRAHIITDDNIPHVHNNTTMSDYTTIRNTFQNEKSKLDQDLITVQSDNDVLFQFTSINPGGGEYLLNVRHYQKSEYDDSCPPFTLAGALGWNMCPHEVIVHDTVITAGYCMYANLYMYIHNFDSQTYTSPLSYKNFLDQDDEVCCFYLSNYPRTKDTDSDKSYTSFPLYNTLKNYKFTCDKQYKINRTDVFVKNVYINEESIINGILILTLFPETSEICYIKFRGKFFGLDMAGNLITSEDCEDLTYKWFCSITQIRGKTILYCVNYVNGTIMQFEIHVTNNILPVITPPSKVTSEMTFTETTCSINNYVGNNKITSYSYNWNIYGNTLLLTNGDDIQMYAITGTQTTFVNLLSGYEYKMSIISNNNQVYMYNHSNRGFYDETSIKNYNFDQCPRGHKRLIEATGDTVCVENKANDYSFYYSKFIKDNLGYEQIHVESFTTVNRQSINLFDIRLYIDGLKNLFTPNGMKNFIVSFFTYPEGWFLPAMVLDLAIFWDSKIWTERITILLSIGLEVILPAFGLFINKFKGLTLSGFSLKRLGKIGISFPKISISLDKINCCRSRLKYVDNTDVDDGPLNTYTDGPPGNNILKSQNDIKIRKMLKIPETRLFVDDERAMQYFVGRDEENNGDVPIEPFTDPELLGPDIDDIIIPVTNGNFRETHLNGLSNKPESLSLSDNTTAQDLEKLVFGETTTMENLDDTVVGKPGGWGWQAFRSTQGGSGQAYPRAWFNPLSDSAKRDVDAKYRLATYDPDELRNVSIMDIIDKLNKKRPGQETVFHSPHDIDSSSGFQRNSISPRNGGIEFNITGKQIGGARPVNSPGASSTISNPAMSTTCHHLGSVSPSRNIPSNDLPTQRIPFDDDVDIPVTRTNVPEYTPQNIPRSYTIHDTGLTYSESQITGMTGDGIRYRLIPDVFNPELGRTIPVNESWFDDMGRVYVFDPRNATDKGRYVYVTDIPPGYILGEPPLMNSAGEIYVQRFVNDKYSYYTFVRDPIETDLWERVQIPPSSNNIIPAEPLRNSSGKILVERFSSDRSSKEVIWIYENDMNPETDILTVEMSPAEEVFVLRNNSRIWIDPLDILPTDKFITWV